MPLTPEQLRHGFRLGDRMVQPARNTITGPGGEAHVEPRAMAVLLCLAERAGEVVSRDEINDAVWGHAVVTDQALTNCISELRQHLGDDRSEPRFIETVPKRGYRLIVPVEPAPASTLDPAESTARPPARESRRTSTITAVVALAAMLAAIAWWTLGPRAGSEPAGIAVLPFENASDREELDYLRLALPDEVTTVLTHASALTVRPFEPDRAGTPAPGGRRGAAHLVTGHFYLEGPDRLSVTIEARDADRDRLVWRGTVSVPVEDLLELRPSIARRVRDGLLPALGTASSSSVPVPADADAYRLFLHSLAVPLDPEPNVRGIELLERALDLDPEFAPAWTAVARRYDHHHAYAGGGEVYLERAVEAARRALALDPNQILAAERLVLLETEAGRLQSAYRRASELVDANRESGPAHFSLSYVLRFGGSLRAAQRHCELALALDPHYQGLRSCAFAYMAAGKLDRAAHFIELDEGSYWSNLVSVHYWLRRGDHDRALQFARRLPPDSVEQRFHLACILNRPEPPPDDVTDAFIEQWLGTRDPEPAYWIGSEMVYCGRNAEALSLLEHAIDGGYCAYPAVELDPAWNDLRGEAGFRRLREMALACHEQFQSATGAH